MSAASVRTPSATVAPATQPARSADVRWLARLGSAAVCFDVRFLAASLIAGLLFGVPATTAAQVPPVPTSTPTPAPTPTPTPTATSGVGYELAPGVVRALLPGGVREVAIGCDGVAMHREGERLYVACGLRGVVVLSLADPSTPTIIARREMDGDVVGVFSGGGRVWAQIARIEAQPIDAATDAPATDASSTTTHSGNSLPPLPTVPAGAPTPPGYSELTAPGGALDDDVPPRGGFKLLMPERIGGIWRIATNADLYLPIGTIGVGGLVDALVSRHFDGPFVLRAQISPLGFAIVNEGGGRAFTAHLVFGLDTQFLELALGIGSSTTESTDVAFSTLMSLRIGALDGLHLAVQTNVVVLDSGFEFGGASAVLQIPLINRWWLITRGGGGPAGYVFGDIGVRYRVSGDGGVGSYFIQGVIGGVALFGSTSCDEFGFCESNDSGGPALGIGAEWRL